VDFFLTINIAPIKSVVDMAKARKTTQSLVQKVAAELKGILALLSMANLG